MSDVFLAVMLASMLAGAVTSLGIYAISKFESWGRRHTVYFKSFAAGALAAAIIVMSKTQD
jgi:hypothetical protein